MTVDDRIRRLEDRAALDDLVVRYFLAADGDDLKGVGDSFMLDATFASSGAISATGRQGIVDFIVASRAQMGLTVHTPNYGLYTFGDDNDRATGLIGAHLELVVADQSLFGAVRYQDQYVRTCEGWLIASRDMRTVYIAPMDELGDAMRSDHPVRWPGISPLPTDFPRSS
ncbi:MAG: nuclear transport factor 2 family protein [Sphingomonadaceae bacterium]